MYVSVCACVRLVSPRDWRAEWRAATHDDNDHDDQTVMMMILLIALLLLIVMIMTTIKILTIISNDDNDNSAKVEAGAIGNTAARRAAPRQQHVAPSPRGDPTLFTARHRGPCVRRGTGDHINFYRTVCRGSV